jgi:hypothetical protein
VLGITQIASAKSLAKCEKDLSLAHKLMTITILFLLLLLLANTTQQQETAIAHTTTTKEYGFLTYENYTYAIRIQLSF